jgi:uncharacterized membrane protein
MKKPPLLRSRTPGTQVTLAVGVPLVFGGVVGVVLGHSAGWYWILLAVAALGAVLSGLDHDDTGEALARGAISGAMFGLGIVAVHDLANTAAKVALGSLPAALILIDAIAGAALTALGCWALRRRGRRRPVTDLSPGRSQL